MVTLVLNRCASLFLFIFLAIICDLASAQVAWKGSHYSCSSKIISNSVDFDLQNQYGIHIENCVFKEPVVLRNGYTMSVVIENSVFERGLLLHSLAISPDASAPSTIPHYAIDHAGILVNRTNFTTVHERGKNVLCVQNAVISTPNLQFGILVTTSTFNGSTSGIRIHNSVIEGARKGAVTLVYEDESAKVRDRTLVRTYITEGPFMGNGAQLNVTDSILRVSISTAVIFSNRLDYLVSGYTHRCRGLMEANTLVFLRNTSLEKGNSVVASNLDLSDGSRVALDALTLRHTHGELHIREVDDRKSCVVVLPTISRVNWLDAEIPSLFSSVLSNDDELDAVDGRNRDDITVFVKGTYRVEGVLLQNGQTKHVQNGDSTNVAKVAIHNFTVEENSQLVFGGDDPNIILPVNVSSVGRMEINLYNGNVELNSSVLIQHLVESEYTQIHQLTVRRHSSINLLNVSHPHTSRFHIQLTELTVHDASAVSLTGVMNVRILTLVLSNFTGGSKFSISNSSWVASTSSTQNSAIISQTTSFIGVGSSFTVVNVAVFSPRGGTKAILFSSHPSRKPIQIGSGRFVREIPFSSGALFAVRDCLFRTLHVAVSFFDTNVVGGYWYTHSWISNATMIIRNSRLGARSSTILHVNAGNNSMLDFDESAFHNTVTIQGDNTAHRAEPLDPLDDFGALDGDGPSAVSIDIPMVLNHLYSLKLKDIGVGVKSIAESEASGTTSNVGVSWRVAHLLDLDDVAFLRWELASSPLPSVRLLSSGVDAVVKLARWNITGGSTSLLQLTCRKNAQDGDAANITTPLSSSSDPPCVFDQVTISNSTFSNGGRLEFVDVVFAHVGVVTCENCLFQNQGTFSLSHVQPNQEATYRVGPLLYLKGSALAPTHNPGTEMDGVVKGEHSLLANCAHLAIVHSQLGAIVVENTRITNASITLANVSVRFTYPFSGLYFTSAIDFYSSPLVGKLSALIIRNSSIYTDRGGAGIIFRNKDRKSFPVSKATDPHLTGIAFGQGASLVLEHSFVMGSREALTTRASKPSSSYVTLISDASFISVNTTYSLQSATSDFATLKLDVNGTNTKILLDEAVFTPTSDLDIDGFFAAAGDGSVPFSFPSQNVTMRRLKMKKGICVQGLCKQDVPTSPFSQTILRATNDIFLESIVVSNAHQLVFDALENNGKRTRVVLELVDFVVENESAITFTTTLFQLNARGGFSKITLNRGLVTNSSRTEVVFGLPLRFSPRCTFDAEQVAVNGNSSMRIVTSILNYVTFNNCTWRHNAFLHVDESKLYNLAVKLSHFAEKSSVHITSTTLQTVSNLPAIGLESTLVEGEGARLIVWNTTFNAGTSADAVRVMFTPAAPAFIHGATLQILNSTFDVSGHMLINYLHTTDIGQFLNASIELRSNRLLRSGLHCFLRLTKATRLVMDRPSVSNVHLQLIGSNLSSANALPPPSIIIPSLLDVDELEVQGITSWVFEHGGTSVKPVPPIVIRAKRVTIHGMSLNGPKDAVVFTTTTKLGEMSSRIELVDFSVTNGSSIVVDQALVYSFILENSNVSGGGSLVFHNCSFDQFIEVQKCRFSDGAKLHLLNTTRHTSHSLDVKIASSTFSDGSHVLLDAFEDEALDYIHISSSEFFNSSFTLKNALIKHGRCVYLYESAFQGTTSVFGIIDSTLISTSHAIRVRAAITHKMKYIFDATTVYEMPVFGDGSTFALKNTLVTSRNVGFTTFYGHGTQHIGTFSGYDNALLLGAPSSLVLINSTFVSTGSTTEVFRVDLGQTGSFVMDADSIINRTEQTPKGAQYFISCTNWTLGRGGIIETIPAINHTLEDVSYRCNNNGTELEVLSTAEQTSIVDGTESSLLSLSLDWRTRQQYLELVQAAHDVVHNPSGPQSKHAEFPNVGTDQSFCRDSCQALQHESSSLGHQIQLIRDSLDECRMQPTPPQTPRPTPVPSTSPPTATLTTSKQPLSASVTLLRQRSASNSVIMTRSNHQTTSLSLIPSATIAREPSPPPSLVATPSPPTLAPPTQPPLTESPTPEPTPPPVPKAQVVVTTTAATTSVAVSAAAGAAGGGGSAADMQGMLAVGLTSCAGGSLKDLADGGRTALLPAGDALGDFESAALLGSLCIAVAFAVLQGVVVVVMKLASGRCFRRGKGPLPSYYKAAALVRFPSYVWVVTTLLYQGLSLESLRLVVAAPSSVTTLDRGVGVVGLLICLAMPVTAVVWCRFQLQRFSFLQFDYDGKLSSTDNAGDDLNAQLSQQASSKPPNAILRLLIYPVGYWKKHDDMLVLKALGGSLRGADMWAFASVSHIRTLLVSVVVALPSEFVGCTAQSVLLIIVFLGYALVMAVFQPCRMRGTMVGSVLLSLVSALVAATLLDDALSSLAPILLTAASFLSLINVGLLIVGVLLQLLFKKRKKYPMVNSGNSSSDSSDTDVNEDDVFDAPKTRRSVRQSRTATSISDSSSDDSVEMLAVPLLDGENIENFSRSTNPAHQRSHQAQENPLLESN